MSRAADMKARLLEQFKGLPNLGAFLDAIGAQMDDLDEFFNQLLNNLTLQNAVGAQLDGLGLLLGQGREAMTDDDYRTVLQARIVQYQGNATMEDIIQLLLVLGGASSMVVSEYQPARFQVVVADIDPLVSIGDLGSAVLQSKLAGVQAEVLIPSPTNPQFTFDHAVDGTHAGFDQGHLSGPIF